MNGIRKYIVKKKKKGKSLTEKSAKFCVLQIYRNCTQLVHVMSMFYVM